MIERCNVEVFPLDKSWYFSISLLIDDPIQILPDKDVGANISLLKHSILTGTSILMHIHKSLCCQQIPWSQAGSLKSCNAILVEYIFNYIYWFRYRYFIIWHGIYVYVTQLYIAHVFLSYAAQVCFEKWRPLENRTGWVWGLVSIWIAVVR